MGEQYSIDGTNGTVTLAAGASQSFTVDTTGRNGDVVIFVDNGSAGGTPATYDLTVDVAHADGTTQRFGSDTSTTAFTLTDPAVPEEMEYTLTNSSGASADYRVKVVSYR